MRDLDSFTYSVQPCRSICSLRAPDAKSSKGAPLFSAPDWLSTGRSLSMTLISSSAETRQCLMGEESSNSMSVWNVNVDKGRLDALAAAVRKLSRTRVQSAL